MGDQMVTVYRVKYWDDQRGDYVYPPKMRRFAVIAVTDGMTMVEGSALKVKASDLDDEGAYQPKG